MCCSWATSFSGSHRKIIVRLPIILRAFTVSDNVNRIEIQVFHPGGSGRGGGGGGGGGGGDLPYLATPKHTLFIFIIVLYNRESRFWTWSHFQSHHTFTKNGE